MATGTDLVKKATDPGYYKGKWGAAFLASDMLSIGTADNKAKALLQTLGRLVQFNLFGWAGVAAGGFLGLRTAIKAVVQDSGSLEAALRSLAKVQLYAAQFAPFVGGAKAARQHVADLAKEAGKPWKLEQLVEASRNLTILTRGTFASAAALKMVGDAAARSGQNLGEVSTHVGTLKAELRDGQPIAATAGALEAMGIVSRQTAGRLGEMQSSGEGLGAMWSLVEADLQKASGASDRMAESVQGLQNRYQSAREVLNQRFGEAFLASEQAGLKNTITALEQLAPVASAVAKPLASVVSVGNNVGSWIAKTVTSIPHLADAASIATRSFIGLGLAAGAVTVVRLGQSIMALTPSVTGFARAVASGTLEVEAAAAANRLLARAEMDTTLATIAATEAEEIRTAAGAALTVEQEAEAAALTRTSLALRAQAMGLTASARMAGPLAAGVTTLTSSFKNLAAVVIMSPWTWLILAIGAVVGVTSHVISKHEEHKKALDDLRKAGHDVVQGLHEQAAAMKTLDDRQSALLASTLALADARARLAQLQIEGAPKEQVQEQKKQVARLQKEMQDIQNAKGLAPGAKEQGRREDLARGAVDLREAEYDARMALASPSEQRRLREERMAEDRHKIELGKSNGAVRAAVEQERTKYDVDIAGDSEESGKINGILANSPNQRIQERNKVEQERIDYLRSDKGGLLSEDEARRKARQERTAGLEASVAAGALTVTGEFGAVDLNSHVDDEAAELQALRRQKKLEGHKAAMIDQQSDVALDANRFRQDTIVAREAQVAKDLREKRISPEEAAARKADLAGQKYDLEEHLGQRQQRLPQEQVEQRQSLRSRKSSRIDLDEEKEIAAIRARGLDAAEQEAAAQVRGLERHLALVQLINASQHNADTTAERELLNKLALRKKDLEMIHEQAALQREADAAHLHIAELATKATVATAAGHFAEAARLRDEKIQAEDAAAYRESVEQKRSSGSYTKEQAEAAAAAEQREREADRKAQRDAFNLTNKRALDEQELSMSKDPADRRKAIGMKDEDKAREHIADALDHGATPQEAFAYAQRASSLDFQKQQLDQGRGVIVDSLQRVGGGGGIAGTDPMMSIQQRQLELQTRMANALEQMTKGGDQRQPTPPVSFSGI